MGTTKTLIDLYNNDFPEFLNIKRDIIICSPSLQQQIPVIQRLHFDFDNRSSFLSFYISTPDLSTLNILTSILFNSEQVVNELSSTVQTAQGGTDGNLIYSTELIYSRTIYLYCEQSLSDTDCSQLQDAGSKQNINVVVRSNGYVHCRNELEEVIVTFLKQYEGEQQAYGRCVTLLQAELTKCLKEAKIPAWVTARTKSLESLKKKVWKRALPVETGRIYKAISDIYDDIVDLGGIRIALYFPAQRKNVKEVIEKCCGPSQQKIYTGDKALSSYERRFSGYWATHYRTVFKPNHQFVLNCLSHNVCIEIQVASIVMHTWAEVAHDLEYKQLQGQLWEEEEKLLDQLNGLVLAGEMVLELLQNAGDKRQARLKELIENAQANIQSEIEN
jgi:ppGpp synthetase/RelA/SpoT-type nucleotidyltranferase